MKYILLSLFTWLASSSFSQTATTQTATKSTTVAGPTSQTSTDSKSITTVTSVPVTMAPKKKLVPIKIKRDAEAEANIKKIFDEKLDPAAVLKDFPPKFITLKDIPHTPFETMGDLPNDRTTAIMLPGFLYEDEPEYVGKVLGGFEGEKIIGTGSSALFRVTGEVQKGKRYSILSLVRKFRASGEGWYHYAYAGEAYVSEFEGKNRAVFVKEGPSVTREDDILIPLIEVHKKVDADLARYAPLKYDARVISMIDEQSAIAGQGHFIYLDKGLNDGVMLNQILFLYVDSDRDQLGLNTRSIGTAQVVDVMPASSTAYIINSLREIHVGDLATGS